VKKKRDEEQERENELAELYRRGGFSPMAQQRPTARRNWSFEAEFAARFGCTPDEAHELRKLPLEEARRRLRLKP